MPPQNDRQNTAALSKANDAEDRAEIERLLGEHRAYLCRVATARLGGNLQRRVDASDVVQDAQAEAFRRMDAYLKDPRVPVKIWLRKLVIEQLITAQRRHVGAARRSVTRESLPEGTAIDVAEKLLADEKSPSQIVSKQESASRLREALDRLPDADREIILMHLYEGLNSQESGAALGIEPAAARKRLARALARLREMLGQEDLGASSF
jgi:RNA polymerase sigma-70 factor (ECF subfamily)